MNFGRYDEQDTISRFWAVLIVLVLLSPVCMALFALVQGRV